uniref:Uncharacterized protein n=1 Tax=Oryza meridionalis TaxID=40149 RepID=A0A0E0C498_9ORYZ
MPMQSQARKPVPGLFEFLAIIPWMNLGLEKLFVAADEIPEGMMLFLLSPSATCIGADALKADMKNVN